MPGDPRHTFPRGLLYVLRKGCQWKHTPRKFISGPTLHRRFQQRRVVFTRLWRLLRDYDRRRRIRWRWQSIESAMTSPFGRRGAGQKLGGSQQTRHQAARRLQPEVRPAGACCDEGEPV
jgi:transposase